MYAISICQTLPSKTQSNHWAKLIGRKRQRVNACFVLWNVWTAGTCALVKPKQIPPVASSSPSLSPHHHHIRISSILKLEPMQKWTLSYTHHTRHLQPPFLDLCIFFMNLSNQCDNCQYFSWHFHFWQRIKTHTHTCTHTSTCGVTHRLPPNENQ